MTDERPGVRFDFTGGCRIGMPMVLSTAPDGTPTVTTAPLRTRAQVIFEREKAALRLLRGGDLRKPLSTAGVNQ